MHRGTADSYCPAGDRTYAVDRPGARQYSEATITVKCINASERAMTTDEGRRQESNTVYDFQPFFIS